MDSLLPINDAYENALAQIGGELPESLRYAIEELQAQTQRISLFLELPDLHQELQGYDPVLQHPPEFTLFQELPVEIRLKIYRMMFPPGRHIDLVVQALAPRHETCNHPPPLQICREGREEALRHYNIVKRPWAVRGSGGIGGRRLWYFSPKRDSCYLHSKDLVFGSLDTCGLGFRLWPCKDSTNSYILAGVTQLTIYSKDWSRDVRRFSKSARILDFDPVTCGGRGHLVFLQHVKHIRLLHVNNLPTNKKLSPTPFQLRPRAPVSSTEMEQCAASIQDYHWQRHNDRDTLVGPWGKQLYGNNNSGVPKVTAAHRSTPFATRSEETVEWEDLASAKLLTRLPSDHEKDELDDNDLLVGNGTRGVLAWKRGSTWEWR